MSNRKKLKPLHGGVRPQWTPLPAASAFNRLARKACSDCGAPIKWVDVEAARAHGMEVQEALRFLGVSSTDEIECWICTACDNAGVMGPTAAG